MEVKPEKPWKCPLCPSTFSHKQNVPRHIATVHEGKKQGEKLTNVNTKEKLENVKVDGELLTIFFFKIKNFEAAHRKFEFSHSLKLAISETDGYQKDNLQVVKKCPPFLTILLPFKSYFQQLLDF